MYFVPEGQRDSSQARSAWNYEENSLVPAGRSNRLILIQDLSYAVTSDSEALLEEVSKPLGAYASAIEANG